MQENKPEVPEEQPVVEQDPAGTAANEPEVAEDTEGSEDEDEEDSTATAAPSLAPNIMHVGDEIPLTKINNGMETIKLPKVEDQQKPFYHKKAGTIVALFSDQYKHYVKKGK